MLLVSIPPTVEADEEAGVIIMHIWLPDPQYSLVGGSTRPPLISDGFFLWLNLYTENLLIYL